MTQKTHNTYTNKNEKTKTRKGTEEDGGEKNEDIGEATTTTRQKKQQTKKSKQMKEQKEDRETREK